MASPGTCPRGHELAEDAVYCTVCWVRVEPVAAEVVAERKRRQRRIWIPLMGAGAVVLGVVVGGSLGVGSGSVSEPDVVAGEAVLPSSAPATPAPETSAAATPSASAAEVVVAAPLAATVPESTTRTLEACVPADAAAVLLKGRSTTDEPWIEATADVLIGDQAACAEGEVSVAISSDTDALRWRLVVKDASGERIDKLTLDAPES